MKKEKLRDVIFEVTNPQKNLGGIEIWKDIPGYEGLYKVSNFGNVKSLERKSFMLINNCERIYKEKIRKQIKNTRGYYTINLNKENYIKGFSVHQLVAMAFLNHIPSGMNLVIDHIDENKLNNKLENLQIITQRENAHKYYKQQKCESKYVGVTLDKKTNRWRARTHINGIREHLGMFKTEIEANNILKTKYYETR
jgi:hypothetical protein